MPLIFWITSAFIGGTLFAGRAHAEALKTQEHRKQVHEKLDELHQKVAALESKNKIA